MQQDIDKKSEKAYVANLSFPWIRTAFCLLAAFLCCILAALIGSVTIAPDAAIAITFTRLPFIEIKNDWPVSWNIILWELRYPRIALAMLVGAALSVSGATYQGLFRNPLADPYLIGVASGAALGATIVFLSGIPSVIAGVSILPIAAFIGGIGAVTAAYTLARRSTGTPLTTLILAGVAIGSFTTAVASILMLRSDPDLRPILSWLMGGFIRAQWSQSLYLLPYLILGFTVVFTYSRILNAMQLEEDYASSVGVNVEKTKKILILTATVITAAAVSFSGLIGFVGLVAPHTARLIWGSDFRNLIPMSALLGGCFLVLSDLVARTIVSPGELPVGIITSLVGAPFFIYLLVRNRSNIQ